MKLKYIKRSINNSESLNDFIDNDAYLKDGDKKRCILKKNPFINSCDDIFQICACDDNKIIASGYHFATSLIVNKKETKCITCSTLSVDNNYRRQGIGSQIHKMRMEYSENGVILIGSVSQMQYSIMQKLGAKLFFSPRLMFLKKSRAVVEIFSKGFISKIIEIICNFFLYLLHIITNFVAFINGRRKYEIISVTEVDDDYEKIWEQSKGKFKENHNHKWIKWVLESNPHCKLYYIKKRNKTLGWFLLKDEFHEQASQRGFKNVTLRSIIEWESIDIKELSYFKICLFAITMPGKIDAIEFIPFDNALCKKMRLLGGVQIGKGNIVLRLSEDSSLIDENGIFEENYWRLRPAAGDNMIF